MKRYTGTMDGIYPAGKTYCYSTELMYFWLNQVCLQGLSFRTAYKNSNLLSSSPGLKYRNLKLPNLGSNRLDGDKRMSRRRASTAFYGFLSTIDTKSEIITNRLFSCATCEVTLSPMDLKELGIREEDGRSLKRMKAIVIDGTAAGVLNRLPDMERKLPEIRSINEEPCNRRMLKNRLVNVASHRKVLEKLLTVTREVLRMSLKHGRIGHSSGIQSIRFWLTNESGDVVGVEKTKTKFTMLESYLSQLFCTENSCICPEGSIQGIPVQNHSEECQELRASFLQKTEVHEIFKLLSRVFRITRGESSFSIAVEENEQTSEVETGLSEDSESSDASTESSNCSEVEPPQVPAPLNINERGFIAHLLVHGGKSNPQFAESLLSLLHLVLTEHVAMPYLGRIPGQGEDPVESPSMLSFTSVSLQLHDTAAGCIQDLVHFTHIGMEAAILLQDDCDCNAAMRNAVMSMQDAKHVLETFCVELLKVKRPFSSRLGALIGSLVRLLRRHVEAAKAFFLDFEMRCGDDIKDYWKNYCLRDPNATEDVVAEGVETGIWFPDRRECRPGIIFKSLDVRQCKKKYSKSQRHSAGLMTVQCACQSPKLLVFIIMTRAESVALALSSLLTHFPVLPRTIYYDNACNMFSSAILRVPWVFRQTRMAVDRFHYKSHKCNSLFNPDSCSNFDAHRTETAESINARIEKSLPYMRYLGTESLLPFLRVRFSLINLCALNQQTFNRSDLEEEDLTSFFQSVCACDCVLCTSYESEIDTKEPPEDQDEVLRPEQFARKKRRRVIRAKSESPNNEGVARMARMAPPQIIRQSNEGPQAVSVTQAKVHSSKVEARKRWQQTEQSVFRLGCLAFRNLQGKKSQNRQDILGHASGQLQSLKFC